MPKEKKCAYKWCQRPFIATNGHQKFCCKKCQHQDYIDRHLEQGKLYEPIKCQTCGKEFLRKSGNQKFCSDKCRNNKIIKPKRRTRTLEEITKLMNDMGYYGNYGKFTIEHPELVYMEGGK